MDNKENRMRLVCGVTVVMCTALFAAVWSFAGDVEPDASPGATMKSLQEVHDKVGEIDAKMTGVAPVARTGQTRMYYCRDDGWMQSGVAWPDPRFTDNGDGTATDNLTGLVWMKNAKCRDEAGGVDMNDSTPYQDALEWSAALADGVCGLSDGSEAGDWRLPNIVELLSLVDYGRHDPALPEGHPFENLDYGYLLGGAGSGGGEACDINYYGAMSSTTSEKSYAYESNYGILFGTGEMINGRRADNFGACLYYLPVRDAKEGELNDPASCTDSDGDGYYAEENCGTAVDCDDTDASVNPGASEICDNGGDDDCDGDVDCDDADCSDYDACCTDSDDDGYYAEANCGTAVDCDDTDASVNPGASEICDDKIDNNCDGYVDEGCIVASSPIPDTGQTTCYDADGHVLDPCPGEGEAFYGQDASYTINPPSYTKLDSEGNELDDNATDWAMVKDNVTGLIWEVKKNDETSIHYSSKEYNWSDAADVFIAQLNDNNFGGSSDWRMPTIKELAYLTDLTISDPCFDTNYFPNIPKRTFRTLSYWSSTATWSVFIRLALDGNTDEQSWTKLVRAVRGEKNNNFTDNGDGTVTDPDTGLMWAKNTADTDEDGDVDSDDQVIWKNALAWCEDLSLAGYDDWRLPTIKELRSIVDYDTSSPAIDTNYFPDTMSSDYWSSTTFMLYPGDAWLLNFKSGNDDYYGKGSIYYVRAVRGGK